VRRACVRQGSLHAALQGMEVMLQRTHMVYISGGSAGQWFLFKGVRDPRLCKGSQHAALHRGEAVPLPLHVVYITGGWPVLTPAWGQWRGLEMLYCTLTHLCRGGGLHAVRWHCISHGAWLVGTESHVANAAGWTGGPICWRCQPGRAPTSLDYLWEMCAAHGHGRTWSDHLCTCVSLVIVSTWQAFYILS
jgi:hypothetical protein